MTRIRYTHIAQPKTEIVPPEEVVFSTNAHAEKSQRVDDGEDAHKPQPPAVIVFAWLRESGGCHGGGRSEAVERVASMKEEDLEMVYECKLSRPFILCGTVGVGDRIIPRSDCSLGNRSAEKGLVGPPIYETQQGFRTQRTISSFLARPQLVEPDVFPLVMKSMSNLLPSSRASILLAHEYRSGSNDAWEVRPFSAPRRLHNCRCWLT